MTKLICIVCPKGCHLKIDEQNGYAVTGNQCDRGDVYGKKELLNPTRTLTSTVRISGASIKRLPVKTSAELPKALHAQVMLLLNDADTCAPVKVGDVIIKNVLGSGANIVATRSLYKI